MKHSPSSLSLFLTRTLPIGIVALIAAPTAGYAETQPASPQGTAPSVTTVAPIGTTTATPAITTAPVATSTPATAITSPAATLPTDGTSSFIGPNSAAPASPVFAPLPTSTPNLPAVQNPAGLNPSGPIDSPYRYLHPSYYPVPVAYPSNNPTIAPGYPVAYPVNGSAAATPANSGQTIQVTTSVNLPYQPNPPVVSPSPVIYPAVPGQSPYPTGLPPYPYGTGPQGSYGLPGTYPAALPAPVGSGVVGNGVYQPPFNNNSFWLQRLMEANRLYRSGQTQQASQIYQQVRTLLEKQTDAQAIDDVMINPNNLPNSAQVTWERILSQSKPTSQSLQSLQVLVQTYPEFMPGYLQLARSLEASGRQTEALAVLDRAATLFPDQAEVVRARVQALTRSKRATDAAIAALQFSVQNPNSPYAAEFKTLAENAMKQTQTTPSSNQTRNVLLGSVLQGGLNYLLTGQATGPVAIVQSLFNLLRGLSSR